MQYLPCTSDIILCPFWRPPLCPSRDHGARFAAGKVDVDRLFAALVPAHQLAARLRLSMLHRGSERLVPFKWFLNVYDISGLHDFWIYFPGHLFPYTDDW